MMISTKGRYALRVLVDMAEHPSDGYIPLKDIARRQEISENIWKASSGRWCSPRSWRGFGARAAATG